MPNVKIRFFDGSSTPERFDQAGGFRKTLLREIVLRPDHWDTEKVEQELERSGWTPCSGCTSGYDPWDYVKTAISETVDEFDGTDLDIIIEVRAISEEQRSRRPDGSIR